MAVRKERHTVRSDWYRTHMFSCVLLTAVAGLTCSDESFALTKTAITVEFVVEDNLLDYEPTEKFKDLLSQYTCNLARKNWGFLNWCCGTPGCNQDGNKLVWTVKLEAEDEMGSLTSWHVDHSIDSSRIHPDRFAQDELFKSISEKPVTSEDQKKLLVLIARQIKKQFKLEAFRDKATDLLVNKAPVAHELMTFKDSLDRTVLTLPFRYCDLSLKEEEEGAGLDELPKFKVNLDFNNQDTNQFVITKVGVVEPDRLQDKKLKGFIKGRVTESVITSSADRPDLPVTDISNTIFSEHLNKVKSVYINSYTHDPASVCSVENSLVTGDPGNSPPQGVQR